MLFRYFKGKHKIFYLLLIGIFFYHCCLAQIDSSLHTANQISNNYLQEINNKTSKYSNRITSKTLKSLTKLAKWENKVKYLLDRVNPTASDKLFGPSAITFSNLLEQFKSKSQKINNASLEYNKYFDQTNTTLKYLESQKSQIDSSKAKVIEFTASKFDSLGLLLAKSEATQEYITQRKKLIIDEAFKSIGRSKYLNRINKECYYYAMSLKNYRDIFDDPKRFEEETIALLKRVPGFDKFIKENNALASLFGTNSTSLLSSNLNGLQTRSAFSSLMENKIAAGGPNGRDFLAQAMQQASSEINNLKSKLLSAGGAETSEELPNFKPNNQKSKTFFQRLEVGTNFQFNRTKNSIPSSTNFGLSIGYKITDKLSSGIGIAYKMGIGTPQKLNITNEGISLRTYLDWKIKKQFYLCGGAELNHEKGFSNFNTLSESRHWQQSALLGISKKIPKGNKLMKSINMQLLYDLLYAKHSPITQPIVFRIGYAIK
jgi:hypothetical protein